MTGRKLLMTFPVTADSHTLDSGKPWPPNFRCAIRSRAIAASASYTGAPVAVSNTPIWLFSGSHCTGNEIGRLRHHLPVLRKRAELHELEQQAFR